MRTSFVIRALAALVALAPVACTQSASPGNTTIILVRHAEKTAEPTADPPLTAADICDAGYDNLFIVTVPANGVASVIRLHFGAATACVGDDKMKE